MWSKEVLFKRSGGFTYVFLVCYHGFMVVFLCFCVFSSGFKFQVRL